MKVGALGKLWVEHELNGDQPTIPLDDNEIAVAILSVVDQLEIDWAQPYGNDVFGQIYEAPAFLLNNGVPRGFLAVLFSDAEIGRVKEPDFRR